MPYYNEQIGFFNHPTTKNEFYKILMILNRIKHRGANCFFYDQIKKIFDYAYYLKYPFNNTEEAIDWMVNKILSKKNHILTKARPSAKITFPILNFDKKDWERVFKSDVNKLINCKGWTWDNLPDSIPVELTILSEKRVNIYDEIFYIKNIKSRLDTKLVKKLNIGRSRFNLSICDNPLSILQSLYPYFNKIKGRFKISTY